MAKTSPPNFCPHTLKVLQDRPAVVGRARQIVEGYEGGVTLRQVLSSSRLSLSVPGSVSSEA
ncbi:hypothetical protein [Streptomyces sp. NPDC004728]|uniref:hypothetical protein n=1 Tax=Streptomyces sp. NPDC004728 TaxID=3154289 RepID=UPI0033A1A5CB